MMWLVDVVGWTGAYDELVKKRPAGSLVTGANITSLLIHVVLIICVQVFVFVFLRAQPWSLSLSLLTYFFAVLSYNLLMDCNTFDLKLSTFYKLLPWLPTWVICHLSPRWPNWCRPVVVAQLVCRPNDWRPFLQAGCPSCRSTNIVRAVKEKSSENGRSWNCKFSGNVPRCTCYSVFPVLDHSAVGCDTELL